MSYQLLLLDDSSTIDQAVSITFDKEPLFEVNRSASPEDLLATAGVLKPDVILLDARLPRTNSFQLCQDLKNHPPTRSTRVLLLAPSVGEFDPQQVITCGADGHVVKPFETQVLIDRVKELVGEPVTPSVASVRRLRRSTPPPPPPAGLKLPEPEPKEPPPSHFAPPPSAQAPITSRVEQAPGPNAPREATPAPVEFEPPQSLPRPAYPELAPPRAEPIPARTDAIPGTEPIPTQPRPAQTEFAPPRAEPIPARTDAVPRTEPQPPRHPVEPEPSHPRPAQTEFAPPRMEPLAAHPGLEPRPTKPPPFPPDVEPDQRDSQPTKPGDIPPPAPHLSGPTDPDPGKAPAPIEDEPQADPVFIPPPMPQGPPPGPVEPEVIPPKMPTPKPSGPLLPPPPVVGALKHKASPAPAPVPMVMAVDPSQSTSKTPGSLPLEAEDIPPDVIPNFEVDLFEISGLHSTPFRTAESQDPSGEGTGVQLPELETMVRSLTNEAIERIVWEVVPQLAETMIRERLHELTEGAASKTNEPAP